MTAFQYPLDLQPGQNDYVMFTASQYRTNRAMSGQANPGGAAGPSSSTIILYMPTTTPAVQQSANWQERRFDGALGEIMADLQSAGADLMHNGKIPVSFQDGMEKGKQAFETLRSEVMKRGPQVESAARQFGVNAIAKVAQTTPNQLMSMSQGKIYNPNVELLYEGPRIRNFNFSFQFVPKSPMEAQRVNEIILEFKKWSSPKEDGGMYEVPHVWQVTYMMNGKENKNMNVFKRAACSAISVQNNQGMNMHMSFDDGMPIITTMSLSFTEVDVITRDDHLDGTSRVGY